MKKLGDSLVEDLSIDDLNGSDDGSLNHFDLCINAEIIVRKELSQFPNQNLI